MVGETRSWSKAASDHIWSRDGAKCIYCGALADLQIDHVVPVAKGGPTRAENGVLSCRRCNMIKFDKLDLEMLVTAFRHLLSHGESLTWLDSALLTVPYIGEHIDTDDVRNSIGVEVGEDDEASGIVPVTSVHESILYTYTWPCPRFRITDLGGYRAGCQITYLIEDCDGLPISVAPISKCESGWGDMCVLAALMRFSSEADRNWERMKHFAKKAQERANIYPDAERPGSDSGEPEYDNEADGS